MLWLGKETPKPASTGGKLPNRRLLRLRLSVLIAERSKSFQVFKTKNRNGKYTVKKLWPSAKGGGASVVVSSFLSLCTGSGGLDLGVIRGSGYTTQPILYVENEATAAAVLASNIQSGKLPDAAIWSDLKTFDFSQWRGVDGIVGGYPCQPFSAIGPKLGAADHRHLWPYIEEGIEAVRPVWCFFENVANHLSLGFDVVAQSLHRLGFEVTATLVRASDVGASHKRERLFILAHSASERSQRDGHKRIASEDGGQEPAGHIGSSRGPLGHYPPSPTDSRWNGVPERLHPSKVKSEFHRLDDGMGRKLDLSRADRLRIAGNGVVPDQAAFAWQELWAEMLDS